jgi:hypothetical protein
MQWQWQQWQWAALNLKSLPLSYLLLLQQRTTNKRQKRPLVLRHY